MTTSLFDRERTAADQIGAVEALAVIVREAGKRKLPPLDWSVSDLGSSLVARVTHNVTREGEGRSRYDYAATAVARRDTFERYIGVLRWLHDQSADRFPARASSDRFPLTLTLRPEYTNVLGVVRLAANLEHVTAPLGGKREKWLLSVFLTADIEPDPEEQP